MVRLPWNLTWCALGNSAPESPSEFFCVGYTGRNSSIEKPSYELGYIVSFPNAHQGDPSERKHQRFRTLKESGLPKEDADFFYEMLSLNRGEWWPRFRYLDAE